MAAVIERLLEQTRVEAKRNVRGIYNGIMRNHEPVTICQEHVQNVMNWTAILLFGATVASGLGAYFFSPILGFFFTKYGAGFFAFIVFPLYEVYTVLNNEHENEINYRFRALSSALTQGLLSGFALSNYHLSAQPLMFVTPIVFAHVFPKIIDLFGQDRRNVVGLCAGAAFLVNLIFGFIVGYATSPYIFLTFLYVLFASLIFLHMIHNAHHANERVKLYHVVLLSGFLIIKCAIFGVFGTTAECRNEQRVPLREIQKQ